MATASFRVWRGDAQGGAFADYRAEISEGMVVLDAIHQIQAEHAHDLKNAIESHMDSREHTKVQLELIRVQEIVAHMPTAPSPHTRGTSHGSRAMSQCRNEFGPAPGGD